jgi:cytochrome c oxidase cbb3-type subunit 3
MKKYNLSALLFFISVVSVFAQNEAKATDLGPSISFTITEILVLALLMFFVVLLLVALTLFHSFKIFFHEKFNPIPFQPYKLPKPLDFEEWLKHRNNKPNIWNIFLGLKPLEKEKDILLPDDYESIKELNNPTPTWFSWLFAAALLFVIGYLYCYQFADGPSQDKEYELEIAKAVDDKRIYLAKFSSKVDENTVTIDAKLVAKGKGVFDANCVSCHGDKGQGKVGPNLTDEFWLHGGSINDIFKVVKYGVPKKGKASWEKNLTAQNISEVTNYILSLQNTKPLGAKLPQGIKYETKTSMDTLVKN